MNQLSLTQRSDGPIAVAQTAPAGASLHSAASPSSLDEFTRLHDLASLISSGAELASRCFDLDQPVHAELVSDQETGETWVELVILARGDIPEVRQARRRFTKEWLRLVPSEKALLIRPGLSLV